MTFRKKLIFVILTTIFIIVSIFFPYDLYTSLEKNMYVTTDELDEMLDGKKIETIINIVVNMTKINFFRNVIKKYSQRNSRSILYNKLNFILSKHW